MTVNHGSKRLVVGAHYGLRDWLSQRVTAVLMALFTVVLVVQVLMPGPLGYDRWAGIFAAQWMKVLSFAVFIALAWHAWVGMRDIWMDYVKPVGTRLVLQVVTLVWLVAAPAGRCRCSGASKYAHINKVNHMALGTLPRRKFDVVIVGAGGSGMQASLRLAQAGSRWRCCPRSPHALAHGGRARRHRRQPGQYVRGQLALSLLRHHQGQRLAR